MIRINNHILCSNFISVYKTKSSESTISLQYKTIMDTPKTTHSKKNQQIFFFFDIIFKKLR